MTNEQKQQVRSAHAWIVKETVQAVFRWFLLGVFAVFVYLATPIKDQVKGVWESPKTLQRIEDKMDSRVQEVDEKLDVMQRSILHLQRPSKIFDVSVLNSGPIEGFCIELRPCDIRIKIKRREETARCRVVPGTVKWAFLNPRTDTISSARQTSPETNRNLGTSWEFIDIQIVTPSGLAPESYFFFTVQYSNCPMQGPEPISDKSENIPFIIYEERP